MITRRAALSAILGSASAPFARLAAAPAKPNIVVIIADDLGYGETSAYGSKDIATPNIDSIAHNGVRFTNGYVSCPVCSPTRAGLMTGRYQQRFGHEFNPGPAQNSDPNFGLPLTETTLAARLKTAGYATGIFGKWHLGYRSEFHPTRRGFDEFFGFLGGAHSYVNANADRTNPILRGEQPVDQIQYTTDEFTREATGFIGRNSARPFFLYLPYNAVHNPLQAIDRYLDRYASIQDPKRRTFAAMMSAMDDGVGRVLDALRASKIEENTFLFFVSDNGGPTAQTSSGNGPLRGFKAQVYEGGIRVPFMVQWRGRLPAGKVYSNPVIALDIHPTALAAAGIAPPTDKRLDGVDLLQFLQGKNNARPHDRLFWRFGPQAAVRLNDWKLILHEGATPALYDLARDIGEKTDLAAQSPDRVAEMKAAYDAWNGQLEPPRWKTNRAAGVGKKGLAKRKRK